MKGNWVYCAQGVSSKKMSRGKKRYLCLGGIHGTTKLNVWGLKLIVSWGLLRTFD